MSVPTVASTSDSTTRQLREEKRRVRRRKFALLAVTLSLLVSLVLGEVILRVYVASRGWTSNCYVTGLIFFVPHDRAGYTLRPNLRLKSSTYDVTTTGEGLRGTQPIAPPEHSSDPSHTRIMVLGGSSVFGYLVLDGQDSCVLLQQELKRRHGRPTTFEVLNAGIPGYNLKQCRLRFEDDLAELNPDYVLLYLGWNDTKFIIADSPEQLDTTPAAPPLWQRVCARSVLYGVLRYRIFPPAAPKFAIPSSSETQVTEAGQQYFVEQLRQLVTSIRNSGTTPIISTQLMAATSESDSLTAFLGSDEEQIAANRAVGRWITDQLKSFAEQEQIILIDAAGEIECDDKILGDAIHLTRLGHEKLAAVWAESLSEKLLKSVSASE